MSIDDQDPIDSIDPSESWGFGTLGIRHAELRSPEMEHSPAIYPTSSYVYRSAAEAAATFLGQREGNVYSRFTNPTVQAFEKRLARMEGGEACVATASGMAAILTLVLTTLKAGDHLLASKGLFGSTINLFNNYIAKLGIEIGYATPSDIESWRAGFKPNTKLVFVETPSNPLTELVDIEALATLAHEHGAALAVDNCFLTPVFQQPLKLGADYVVHSATKFIDGQGRCLGGAIVGDAQRVGKDVYGFMRTAGPCLSPFNAWVFLKGLETLSVRMKAHEQSACQLAQWLSQQPIVSRVLHPSLASHPQHELAKRQQRGFGSIVSFEVRGGRQAAWSVIDATRLCSITGNLGDARTTITHPATTTHGRISEQQRTEAGITEGLIRISVGLEDIEDLIADLRRAFSRAEGG
ncbi:O-succinylhomoserine sulfhydrylase [Hydrocarboniphaga effusa]|uniref:O-succinylhomoserine sulfhydrylase n=1 Tax=Hydrocarboniphaga effusa TaxID=243629 RepID=UPI003138423C